MNCVHKYMHVTHCCSSVCPPVRSKPGDEACVDSLNCLDVCAQHACTNKSCCQHKINARVEHLSFIVVPNLHIRLKVEDKFAPLIKCLVEWCFCFL